MSLWAEHIGGIEESFTRPESLECMRQVRHIGQKNWDQFFSSHVTKIKGHGGLDRVEALGSPCHRS
ncbi:phospholipase D beta 1-like [Panicum miliaceum]|uniref:Phospholipase D beta 1-like n=1 Tax=Panicum miliaceum TaxID=4540 RepID=A0A3L6RWH6_PANMI|nr:phospholipase D beta 1-like [Panicum miliaceum]